MSGITIIGVRIVGLCSKCRKEGDEIPKDKYGVLCGDKDIACINKAFGSCPKQKENNNG